MDGPKDTLPEIALEKTFSYEQVFCYIGISSHWVAIVVRDARYRRIKKRGTRGGGKCLSLTTTLLTTEQTFRVLESILSKKLLLPCKFQDLSTQRQFFLDVYLFFCQKN